MRKTTNPKPGEPKGNTPTSSGTASRQESFKNYGQGNQDFKGAKIHSDSCSCVQSRIGSDGVYVHRGRSQKFHDSEINGAKVESGTTGIAQASSSTGSKITKNTNEKIYCTTCKSFTNHGRGSQKFNGAVIISRPD